MAFRRALRVQAEQVRRCRGQFGGIRILLTGELLYPCGLLATVRSSSSQFNSRSEVTSSFCAMLNVLFDLAQEDPVI